MLSNFMLIFCHLRCFQHVQIKDFLPGGVQARLPENSSDIDFFSPQLIFNSFTVEWAIRIIQGMYKNARSLVRVNGQYSEELEVGVGVHESPTFYTSTPGSYLC